MNKIKIPEKISLIHGNQQLLIEETYNSLIDQILEGRERDWCLERFNVEEMNKLSVIHKNNSIDDFFISIETLPLLSEVKVIVIENFDLIKNTNKKSDNSSVNKLFDSVLNLIKNPPECLWFIFLSKAIKEKDFSKKLYELLKDKWQIIKYVSYDNSSPINWLLQQAKKKNITMTFETAQFFIDIVGNDLSDLNQELEKISIFFSGVNVNEDLIKKNIRGHKNFSIFRMTDALSNKDLLPALEILDNQFKTTPNEHVRIFSILVMQFRRLISIKSLSYQLKKETDILNKISLPPFLGKQLLKQAKNFSNTELINIYLELAYLDLRIKFQSSIAPFLLQELFQSICSGEFEKITQNSFPKK